MARYKHTDMKQTKLIPISFNEQVLPETFEHTLGYIIDEVLDLSVFDERYRNDDTGRPAYDPAVMLKIVLYAYSLGITSSRSIEYACRANVIFMALSGDSHPHFTTIAGFVSQCGDEAIELFRDALLYCDELGLIGREMFAIDGVKLPSNASKEWSGTRADFANKKRKMGKALRYYLKKHREEDRSGGGGDHRDREARHIKTLRAKIKKIQGWLSEHDDKPGKTGKPKKSNITDNESAKMKTSHGVIQGYDGVAVADAKHQVIVHCEAYGEAQEHDLLVPMIDGVRENFQAIGKADDIFDEASICADAGYHTEANMAHLFEQQIDGYVADNLYRKRDPRFASAARHQPKQTPAKARQYLPKDFVFDPKGMTCICPAGKRLYRNGANVIINGFWGVKFRGPKRACVPCTERARCLQHPERTETRQVVFFQGRAAGAKETYTQKMKRKIDTDEGRARYGLRLSTIEPVFGNIRSTLGLDRFTLRGKWKVNGQWLMYSLVHNIGKIHRYGFGYA